MGHFHSVPSTNMAPGNISVPSLGWARAPTSLEWIHRREGLLGQRVDVCLSQRVKLSHHVTHRPAVCGSSRHRTAPTTQCCRSARADVEASVRAHHGSGCIFLMTSKDGHLFTSLSAGHFEITYKTPVKCLAHVREGEFFTVWASCLVNALQVFLQVCAAPSAPRRISFDAHMFITWKSNLLIFSLWFVPSMSLEK